MNTLRTFKKLTVWAIFVLTVGVVSESFVVNAYAAWNPIKEMGKQIESERKKYDPRLDRYRFSLKNGCHNSIRVTLQYIPVGSGYGGVRWETVYYNFAPGEVAFLKETRNAIVNVSAETTEGQKSEWEPKDVNMGNQYVDYTYTLTCR